MQNAADAHFDIASEQGQAPLGLVRRVEGNHRWAVICRGLTGSLSRRSSLDELADVLERGGWSSLRFDYGGSLKPSGGERMRTIPSMVEDVARAVSSLSEEIGRHPDAVVARGFGARLALEALKGYPGVPLIMWAPILWLRTSLELRARLHELRRHNRLEFDNTEMGKEFVDALDDPTDEQIRGWVNPNRAHFIIQGEEDQVATLRLAVEATQLLESAGAKVELILVPGAHPHPKMDVYMQLREVGKVLAGLS